MIFIQYTILAKKSETKELVRIRLSPEVTRHFVWADAAGKHGLMKHSAD
jgi:hypothetical protein